MVRGFITFALWLWAAAGAMAQVTINLSPSLVRTPGTPSQVLYGVANGVFRSTDGGASWTAVYLTEPGRPQPLVNSLVIDSRNPAVLYASTPVESGAVWKSTDSGTTWTRANSGLPPGTGDATHLMQSQSLPQNLYVKVGNLLFKSTDGAATWTRQSTLPGSHRAFAVNSGDPMRMYYIESTGGAWRSVDEGANWTGVGSVNLFADRVTSVTSVATGPRNSDLVYVGVAGSLVRVGATIVAGVHESTDGARTIRPIHGSQPLGLFLDPDGRPFMYETGSAGGLARSADRGVGWASVTLPTGPGFAFIVARDVHFDRNNPDIVYVSSSHGLFKSTNAGTAFTRVEGTVRPTLELPEVPLVFNLQEGERGSTMLPVRVLESNSVAAPFTLATGGEPWLTVTPASGNTPATASVTVDSAGLAPGVYNAAIRLSSSATATATTSVPVRLVVSPRESGGPQYVISTVAGNGQSGLGVDGAQATATPVSPSRVTLDRAGNLFVASAVNHIVYRVDRSGVLTRVAGTGASGFSGDGGMAVAAQLNSALGVAADSQGRLFIVDRFNHRVRMVAGGTITTVAGPSNQVGFGTFSGPVAIAARADDRMTVFSTQGILTVEPPAQVSSAFPTQPRFSRVSGIARDSSGAYYVADTGAHQIFRVNSQGVAAAIAGNGSGGFTGDSAPATAASLNGPEGVVVDAEGNVIFADTANHRIRMVRPDGALRTIAGTGAAGFSGDAGLALSAQINSPSGLAVDSEGNIYFADQSNRRVRKLTRLRVPPPQIGDTSFTNAADGSNRLSGGALFSLFGENLGESGLSAGAPWPALLGGSSVFVNNRAAPLYFNNGRQINGQIPYEILPGPATVRVEAAGGRSREIRVNILPAGPGILGYGDRRAVAVNADGAINAPDAPAAPGSAVVVYLTGIGGVDNPVASGAAASASPLSRPVLPFSAAIGDQEAQILFLGLAPGFVGLAQANLVVPYLPAGDYLLTITVNGVTSNAVFLAIGG
jgi:uncharacterized protein (TIGR03437 family)